MSRLLEAVALAALLATPALAEFGLGRTATPEEIVAWDIDVRPDGLGLPEGRGTVEDGEEIYEERCAACHGDFAEGADRWPALAGGRGTLTTERPVKTIGSYWPYLSTVWDYVNRAMPYGDARSLSNDEVYAITAYLLYSNDIVDDGFELSRENFGEAAMPNAGGFIDDNRPETAIFTARDPCMANCKETVRITTRAAVVDVTPGENADRSEANTTVAPDPALLAEGGKAFGKCTACHQIGAGAQNKAGPQLNGLFGRKAGAAEGFRYSRNMLAAGESGLVWNDETLARFLAKPEDLIGKTTMVFAGLEKKAEIAAIIAFLKASSE